jgi:hypothetical protein
MPKIYYKVVTPDLRSIIINHDKTFCTQYKIGEFVSSPVPETHLCVFESLESAKNFAYSTDKIFECNIKTRIKQPWIPWSSEDLPKLLLHIRLKKKFLRCDLVDRHLPMGTVCCKQVKLLKEI